MKRKDFFFILITEHPSTIFLLFSVFLLFCFQAGICLAFLLATFFQFSFSVSFSYSLSFFLPAFSNHLSLYLFFSFLLYPVASITFFSIVFRLHFLLLIQLFQLLSLFHVAFLRNKNDFTA